MLIFFIHSADPQSRPVASDHYIRTCCPSVCPSALTFQILATQNKFPAKTMFTPSETVQVWPIGSLMTPVLFLLHLSYFLLKVKEFFFNQGLVLILSQIRACLVEVWEKWAIISRTFERNNRFLQQLFFQCLKKETK